VGGGSSWRSSCWDSPSGWFDLVYSASMRALCPPKCPRMLLMCPRLPTPHPPAASCLASLARLTCPACPAPGTTPSARSTSRPTWSCARWALSWRRGAELAAASSPRRAFRLRCLSGSRHQPSCSLHAWKQAPSCLSMLYPHLPVCPACPAAQRGGCQGGPPPGAVLAAAVRAP